MDYDLCLLKECPDYFSRNIETHICQKYKYILAKDKNKCVLKCRECINNITKEMCDEELS